MPGVVLASPGGGPPVVAVPNPWTHMVHRWVGWDDSVWNLCAPDSGVALLAGARGLNMPPIDRYASASPGVAGSRWRGHRTAEREVFWPLKIWNDTGSAEWVAYDSAFWDTMRPDAPGKWEVIQRDGRSRFLTVRFVDDGNQSFDIDPSLVGWATYGITLVAEDPYWKGPTITRSWSQGTASDFFGGTGGPPFFISSGHTLATATIDNPGDVDAWPVWTLNAPFTEAELGVNGQVIEVPFSMSTGSLTIDTDPRAQTAITNAGVDRTGDLGAVGFARVPAGASVPLSLTMTGDGSVQCRLTPSYYRAW